MAAGIYLSQRGQKHYQKLEVVSPQYILLKLAFAAVSNENLGI
jgi:hypothetical protein